MKLLTAAALGVICVVPGSVSGQSNRLYVGGDLAAEVGKRGSVGVGTVTTVGVIGGVRIGRAFRVELGADRGSGEAEPRESEGRLGSQVVPGASREEIERAGIFGRSRHTATAGNGYAARLVWKPSDPGRVTAALFAGFSWRQYHLRRQVTITGVGPAVTFPPEHLMLQNVDERRRKIGAGLNAGFMVPVRIAGGVHLAPELRLTLGVMSDQAIYTVLHTGVRLMWGL